jgi:acetyl-CoA acetyltransferase
VGHVTVELVAASVVVADPLRLLDICAWFLATSGFLLCVIAPECCVNVS